MIKNNDRDVVKNAMAYAVIWAIALLLPMAADFVIGEYSILLLIGTVYLAGAFCMKVFDGTTVRETLSTASYFGHGFLLVLLVLVSIVAISTVLGEVYIAWFATWVAMVLSITLGDYFSR